MDVCEMCGRNESELLICQLCNKQLIFKCYLYHCIEHEVIIYGNCSDLSTWICENCRSNKENQQQNQLRELKHFNSNYENMKKSRQNKIRELMIDNQQQQQQQQTNNDQIVNKERNDSESSGSYKSCEDEDVVIVQNNSDDSVFYNLPDNPQDISEQNDEEKTEEL